MDNLQAVPFRQPDLGPFCAGNNITVMLDGYPVAFEVKFRDQVLEVGSRRQLRKVTRLAVEDKMHRGRLSSPPSIAPYQWWEPSALAEGSNASALRKRFRLR